MQRDRSSEAVKFAPSLAALLVFTLSISVAAAQRPLQSMSDKIHMLNWTGTPASRTTFLENLGIPHKVADAATSPRDPARELYWQLIRTKAPGQSALLFIPSISTVQSAYLFLLHRSQQHWIVRDHRSFACPFSNDVSMTLSRLHSNGYKSILIRNIATGWGTGMLIKNFEVIDVQNGHLRTELSTQSYMDSYAWPSMTLTRVRSKFIVVPAKNGAARAVEEIRSTTHKHHLKVQRRYFRWSKSKQKFVPTPFQIVRAP